MIFKDEDGDLWRAATDGKIWCRTTVEGTGLDDNDDAPADTGWEPVYFTDDAVLLMRNSQLDTTILAALRDMPWQEGDSDGDEMLDADAAEERMYEYNNRDRDNDL